VKNGTLQIGDNTIQCVQQLLIAFQGEYKGYPMLGAGLKNMYNGTPDPFWAGNAKKQLKSALINVDRILCNENGLTITIKEE
jgi:hypothetical protein